MKMFNITMDDARIFKNCIDAIVTLIDEGELDIDKEGIKLRSMDPSQIAMVDFFLPAHAFKEYKLEKGVKIGLNFEDISRVLGRVRAGESVTLSLKDSRLELVFRGKTTRRFNMPLIDIGASVPNEPKIPFETTIKIQANELKEALKDASLVSAHVTLEAEPDKFTISSSSDRGEVNIEIKKDEDAILDFQVKTPAKAMFPLEYMNDLLKGSDSSSILTLNLKKDAPLKLNYAIGEANITYFLAPRIEST